MLEYDLVMAFALWHTGNMSKEVLGLYVNTLCDAYGTESVAEAMLELGLVMDQSQWQITQNQRTNIVQSAYCIICNLWYNKYILKERGNETMKYGFNDYTLYNLTQEHAVSAPMDRVRNFNVDVFIPFMRRKTMTVGDQAMLDALNEMVQMLNEHAKGLRLVKKI